MNNVGILPPLSWVSVSAITNSPQKATTWHISGQNGSIRLYVAYLGNLRHSPLYKGRRTEIKIGVVRMNHRITL